jgi:hypothetical protein
MILYMTLHKEIGLNFFKSAASFPFGINTIFVILKLSGSILSLKKSLMAAQTSSLASPSSFGKTSQPIHQAWRFERPDLE